MAVLFERKRQRERDKGDFDSRNSPWQDSSDKELSVVQMDIQIQERNSTLVQHISLIICETIEMWP